MVEHAIGAARGGDVADECLPLDEARGGGYEEEKGFHGGPLPLLEVIESGGRVVCCNRPCAE